MGPAAAAAAFALSSSCRLPSVVVIAGGGGGGGIRSRSRRRKSRQHRCVASWPSRALSRPSPLPSASIMLRCAAAEEPEQESATETIEPPAKKDKEEEPSAALWLETDAPVASAIVGKYIGARPSDKDDENESESSKNSLQVRGKRRLGIVLHPTSLPGPYGMGDLGDGAIRLLEWMDAAGIRVWQVRVW